VVTAASPLSIFNTVDQWTTGFLVESGLLKLFINGTSSDEQVKHFQDEDTFDFAGAVGTESGVGDWVNVVESVAVEDQVRLTGTGTWQVLHLPWDARVVTSAFFIVKHAAIITVSEFFAKVIDSVDWFSVTSSVVVFEVAPATVLVDSVEVFTG